MNSFKGLFIYTLISIFIFGCQPQEELEKEETNRDQVTSMGAALSCSLKAIYGEDKLSLRRLRTLRFIEDRLTQSMVDYGIQSKIEQAHYLSQLIHESDGLSATVERVIGPSWRRLFGGSEEKWNCDEYLGAVDEDDDFFDNRYVFSKNSYKSKFRGRGLIQLTGCFNYLGFYYHRSSKTEGQLSANSHKTFFTYKDDSNRTVQVGMFCSNEVLEKMDGYFQGMGLELSPFPLISQFEVTSDELALPCKDRGLREMSSTEFVVDSSLWYWKKCQNSTKTRPFLKSSTPRAVAEVTQCVHGRHPTYDDFEKIDCRKSQSGFRENSYCKRLEAFELALNCLNSR